MNIKLTNKATLPTCGSEQAAGMDLYATEDVCIWGYDTHMFDTGVAVELPAGTFGAVFARSGLSAKRGLCLANGVGVIDSDYRGTIKVPLHNLSNERQWIYAGERIAQLVVIPYIPVELKVVDDLTETKRGNGGFGSSGR